MEGLGVNIRKENLASDTQEWYEVDIQMDLKKYFVRIWTGLNLPVP
jgi:hypothetical protein